MPASSRPTSVTTFRCTPTAHAGGTVTAAPLQAGAAETILDIPVGTALGGYTARAGFLGSAGVVDTRKIPISGTFNPSIGVESAPRVKALALTAGDETVVILKVDLIYIYEGMVLRPRAAARSRLRRQGDPRRRRTATRRGRSTTTAVHSSSAAASSASSSTTASSTRSRAPRGRRSPHRRAAKIGFFYDGNFDPTNQVNHDRRGENDSLPGGNVKDNHFYMIRVDGTDDVPIAALPVFGEHGTLNSEDNPLASTDAPGALERVLQEQFDSPVVVMHLQSAGGDNSPSGHGGIDCNVQARQAGRSVLRRGRPKKATVAPRRRS